MSRGSRRKPLDRPTRWTSPRALTLILVFLSGLLLVRFAFAPRPSPSAPSAAPPLPGTTSTSEAKVLRVIDGDTIEVEYQGRREKVRYIGVNTPETRHPTKGVEYYGKEAKAANQRLVEGRTVRLEFDVQRRDKYGRLLAYVFLPDGTFVNAWLVEQGYAQVMTVPPNVKYQDRFLKLQQEAREAGRGLWGRP